MFSLVGNTYPGLSLCLESDIANSSLEVSFPSYIFNQSPELNDTLTFRMKDVGKILIRAIVYL